MFMLDSGAFTFFSSGKKIDWYTYLEEYAKFILQHSVKYFYELDIDDLIGYENVLKLRQKLEMMTGKKSIPVWHISRGIEEFVKMCEQYEYVAIGGLVGGKRHSLQQRTLEKNFPWFIRTAHRNGARIHALGYTKLDKLTDYHFDSVDSTRWNCARFGKLEYFDGKTMRPIDRRKEGKRMRKASEIERSEVMNFTFSEWVKFQLYAEQHL